MSSTEQKLTPDCWSTARWIGANVNGVSGLKRLSADDICGTSSGGAGVLSENLMIPILRDTMASTKEGRICNSRETALLHFSLYQDDLH